MEFDSYDQLFDAIAKLTTEQRKQKVQVAQAGTENSDQTVLQPVFYIDTAGELFDSSCDSVDGTHKADSVVLMGDISGYEDNSESKKFRVAMKALKKIANCTDKELELGDYLRMNVSVAREAMEKIAKIDEKKKVRN